MNVRKPVDYSSMFSALDALMGSDLPQMELYREIGRVVSGRPEKGAAVAAAEYLQSRYRTLADSLLAICAGCGRFTGPTKAALK